MSAESLRQEYEFLRKAAEAKRVEWEAAMLQECGFRVG